VLRPLAPALLAALVLAGCAPSGGGGVDTDEFQGERKAFAEALDELTDAARRGDGQRVCSDLLARALVDRIGRRRCADAVEEQIDDADVFDLDVERIDVRGNRATARVLSDFAGEERPRTVTLVKEGGDWRLAGIAE
jgi:hypothetical protein